jgi:hypothetical protein
MSYPGFFTLPVPYCYSSPPFHLLLLAFSASGVCQRDARGHHVSVCRGRAAVAHLREAGVLHPADEPHRRALRDRSGGIPRGVIAARSVEVLGMLQCAGAALAVDLVLYDTQCCYSGVNRCDIAKMAADEISPLTLNPLQERIRPDSLNDTIISSSYEGLTTLLGPPSGWELPVRSCSRPASTLNGRSNDQMIRH